MYCIGEDYKYRGEEGAQPPMAGAQEGHSPLSLL
jgi:hypothetical protein